VTGWSGEVPEALDGMRVDKAVALLTGRTRVAVSGLVASGRVAVDGVVVTSRSTALRTGQMLTVEAEEESGRIRPGPEPDVIFEVLHADEAVVVVDKPAGLVVHPGHGHPTGTLVNGLFARFPEVATVGDPARPGIVHRLDRGTSGLLVVARTAGAYDALVAQLAARTVARTYRALVEGSVADDAGIVDAPVGRSHSSPTAMAVTRAGRPARTRYQVEERLGGPRPATLLEVTLETGRTHQIRVHLAAIGHPVAGDPVYGPVRTPAGGAPARPFLHACRLAFVHPVTGADVSWESALPADLLAELAVRRARTEAGGRRDG
jgi:23S rRNA pseudouridine1911/1915/1917 synthase